MSTKTNRWKRILNQTRPLVTITEGGKTWIERQGTVKTSALFCPNMKPETRDRISKLASIFK